MQLQQKTGDLDHSSTTIGCNDDELNLKGSSVSETPPVELITPHIFGSEKSNKLFTPIIWHSLRGSAPSDESDDDEGIMLTEVDIDEGILIQNIRSSKISTTSIKK